MLYNSKDRTEYLVNAKDVYDVLKKAEGYKEIDIPLVSAGLMKRTPDYYDGKGMPYWRIYHGKRQNYKNSVLCYVDWIDKTKTPESYWGQKEVIHDR